MAPAASGRSESERPREPATRPSTLTSTRPCPSPAGSQSMPVAWRISSQRALPAATRRPSTLPSTPMPGPSTTSCGIVSASDRARAAATIALPTMFGDSCSTDAASRRSSSGSMSPLGVTASTTGVPLVSVPVLSSSTVLASPSRSIAVDPFAMMPRFAARETPEMRATGAARISGHGVATTSTARARTGSPLSAQAPPARMTVTISITIA